MKKITFWIFLIIICFPRVPIYGSGVSASAIRIDTIFSVILGFLLAINYLRQKRYILLFSLIIIFLTFQINSDVSFASFTYPFMILSLLFPFQLTRKITHEQLLSMYYLIKATAICNIILAISFRLFSIDCFLASWVSDSDTCILGSYGFSSQPYVFASVTATSLIIYLLQAKKISILELFIYFTGLAISDSRSIAFLLIVPSLYLLSRRSWKIFIVSIILIVLGSLLIGGKMSPEYTTSLGANDPSWLMRSINISNYFAWVDAYKFFLGGGFLAFLQFSVQYGIPGPLDMLYFRVLSEVGLCGLILFSLIICNQINQAPCNKSIIPILSQRALTGSLILLLLSIFIIGFFHEILLVSKTSHLLFLCIALINTQLKNMRGIDYDKH